MKTVTLSTLIHSPEFRNKDGALTDAAYAAYDSARRAHPEEFVPDDELDTTLVMIPTMKTFQYYSGDALTASPATKGDWDGDIFTAADGSQWITDLTDGDPRVDGTGIHYLIPV